MNTKQPQSILLNLFQNKTQAFIAEIFFLFVAGIFAAVAQQYLKMPMQLPGKQGLLFMLILSSTVTLSRIKGAGTITSSGATAFMLLFQVSSGDVFKPFLILFVGIVLDFLISFWRKIGQPLFFLGLAGALSWAVIPVSRMFISMFSGVYFYSFSSGVLYPIATHLLFGFTAAIITGLAFKKYYK